MDPLQEAGFTEGDFFQLIQQSNSFQHIKRNAVTIRRIVTNGIAKTALMQLALTNESKLVDFLNLNISQQTPEEISNFICEAQRLHSHDDKSKKDHPEM